MKKAILEIIFILLDWVLPWKLKKKLPLIFIEPKKILVNSNDWHSQQSFFVKNIYKKTLFEIYILVEYKPATTADIEIKKNTINNEHEVRVKDIILNYDLIINNLRIDNKEDVTLLRIHQINPGINEQFKITCKSSCEVKLKVLGFSNKESKIAIKENAAAVPITLPENYFDNKKISPISQNILTKRVN